MSPCEACRSEFLTAEPEYEALNDPLLTYRLCLFQYEGRAAQAVRRLKYERATSLAPWMAERVAEAVAAHRLDPELVIPVPIHWSRRCQRGFNQAEVLCASIPRVQRTLMRIRRTRPQVGLSLDERAKNLAGAFRSESSLVGQRVLLVDDVFTTGHTARECARSLRAAGAAEVGVLAFCGES